MKRFTYILIGATLAPVFLALALLMFYLAPQQPLIAALVRCSIGILFLTIACVAGTAIRAALRNPPWWIISPEKIHRSGRLVLTHQILKAAKRRARIAEKNVQLTKKMMDLAERLQKLEPAELGLHRGPLEASFHD